MKWCTGAASESRWWFVFSAAFACLLAVLSVGSSLGADDPDNRLLARAQDHNFIMRALERERQFASPSLAVTGITVPHHLLAADLIARGVLAASGGAYDQMLIISPDHFLSLKTPFGITTADLETSFGLLAADRPFVQRVLAASNMFTDIGAAPREHGIHAITPFIRAIFPGVRIAAITTATGCTPAQLRAVAELLGSMVRPRTLIIQSTDYSHLLPDRIAALRDQETVSALASGDPQAVLSLTQPNHTDSRASQVIQMTLQRKLYNAAPVIVANGNAHDYVPGTGSTTTYIVTIYTPEPERGWRLRYPDQTVIYFGGDTYIGRGWVDPAMRASGMNWLAGQIKALTGDFPLVVNLDGIVLDKRPAGANDGNHLMLSELALPVLKILGATAVNSANSHARHFGQEELEESTRLLEANDIRVLRHGVAAQFGGVNIFPLNLDRRYFPDHDVRSQLESICALQSTSPLIVLANWGGDYSDQLRPFERKVTEELAKCGVSALIGAHSRRAFSRAEVRAGGALQSVFSMGKLISDQTGVDISGALVEMRGFRQGTVALRVIPIPNFAEIFKSSDRP
jgi:AmmeMemoRadiSam system protein B